jgi:hypothetical protein
MTKLKQIFEITVWYRFVVAGEQEKEYDIHYILATDLQSAVNEASDLYRTHRAIPFQFIFNDEKQKPTIITKEDIFNLTSPVL